MNAETAGPSSSPDADWVDSQRRWSAGWRRVGLAAVPAVYLIFLASSVSENSHGGAQVAGYMILAGFTLCWLASPLLLTESSTVRRFWVFYGIMFALFVAELPFGRAASFVLCVFLTILTVGRLGAWSAPVVATFAVAALVVPVLIPSWHVSVRASFDDVTPVAIPVVALVTFAIFQVLRGNQALAEARTELTRLAAENERMRIARDLHDLLGHSLTTITVKAGLARRLGPVDQMRANQEIAEVEALARQALTDVRAAVDGYREVSLVGELARGRELLQAAGISGDLPRAVDGIGPDRQELFGWVVREGLTNIVRHSRAGSCSVRISPSGIEIVDDGAGGLADAGNGICGLRERAATAGGVVEAGPAQPRGWRLRVSLGPEGGS